LQHLTIFSNRFIFTNQGKLLKNLLCLVLCFDNSLPWPIDIPKIFFIAISFNRNIVFKNVSSDVGLSKVCLSRPAVSNTRPTSFIWSFLDSYFDNEGKLNIEKYWLYHKKPLKLVSVYAHVLANLSLILPAKPKELPTPVLDYCFQLKATLWDRKFYAAPYPAFNWQSEAL